MTPPSCNTTGSGGGRARGLGLALGALSLAPALANAGQDPYFARWETLGVEQGLPSEKVTAVTVDGARVWAGTEAGLALVDESGVRVFGEEHGLPFRVISALAVEPGTGDLWIGTLGGLARWSAGRIDAFTQLDSGLANDVIYGVAVDAGDVWIATAAGTSRYTPATRVWEIYDVTNTLMHEPWCYGVAAADGDVYIAVWGGGVVVRDGETGTFRDHRDPDGEMELDLYRDDGLVHDVTSSISVADGVMWVGTYFGLSRYDGRRWRSYCQEDSGLAGDFINALRADGPLVWIATDSGLSRFDSRDWATWRRDEAGGWELALTAADGTRELRSVAAGPASDTIYGVAVDGASLWLATASGLCHAVAHEDPRSAPAASGALSEDGER